MKAKIETTGSSQAMLTFTPENKDEAEQLKKLVMFVHRNSYIFPRGYTYMSPDVEFLIQSGYSGRD